MSEPIDLELVKLRATVRGWVFESNDPDSALVKCGYGGWIVFCAGRPPWRECDKRIEATLTAPRWTLDRLLSEPPEGWTHQRTWNTPGDILAWLTWGGSMRAESGRHEVTVIVERSPDALRMFPSIFGGAGHEGLARLAERHKAAAELAYIPAEVEPLA